MKTNPLERAAELIEERGWCRGHFRNDDGRICLDFALITADLVNNERARTCVSDELAARGVLCDNLVMWNDFYATEAAEVVGLLRDAARRWETVPTGQRAAG
ncbi:MAG: DUF6197 family protein [Acidimicrobiales bacterium]